MPMVKTTLQAALQAAFSKSRQSETAAIEAANEIADAIDAYIRTATVTTVVVGTATPAGVVSGTGTGTLA